MKKQKVQSAIYKLSLYNIGSYDEKWARNIENSYNLREPENIKLSKSKSAMINQLKADINDASTWINVDQCVTESEFSMNEANIIFKFKAHKIHAGKSRFNVIVLYELQFDKYTPALIKFVDTLDFSKEVANYTIYFNKKFLNKEILPDLTAQIMGDKK